MAARSHKILFVGNSFTARNNLPGLIATLAKERGISIEHRLINMGGASLRMHWNKGEAAEAIRTGKYDYVVLQEQSTLPIKNRTRFHANVKLFDELIRSSGAKMVLYMTWARQHVPETQKQLTEGYESIGKELGVIVVRAGAAWERFLSKHKQPALHDKDKSHPSLAGSYLAACVFLKDLLKADPSGISIEIKGLGASDAELLQNAAAG